MSKIPKKLKKKFSFKSLLKNKDIRRAFEIKKTATERVTGTRKKQIL
jgi:hypothetical protein